MSDARPEGEHRERSSQRTRRVSKDGGSYRALHCRDGAGYCLDLPLTRYLCLFALWFGGNAWNRYHGLALGMVYHDMLCSVYVYLEHNDDDAMMLMWNIITIPFDIVA